MIYDLAREGRTIFVTTHYLDEAEHANRIGMMHHGVLRAMASPGELKRSLQGQLLKISCSAPFDAVAYIKELPGIENVALQGNDVHVLIDPEVQSAESITLRLNQVGIGVTEIRPVEPTLEDVFINLIGRAGASDPTE